MNGRYREITNILIPKVRKEIYDELSPEYKKLIDKVNGNIKRPPSPPCNRDSYFFIMNTLGKDRQLQRRKKRKKEFDRRVEPVTSQYKSFLCRLEQDVQSEVKRKKISVKP